MTKSIPFTQAEMNLITDCATGEEAQLYFSLLRLVDFGRVFPERDTLKRVNLSETARLMARKSRQGKPAITYTRKEIRRLLDRLSSIGLVDEISREGKYLNFRLPHIYMEACH